LVHRDIENRRRYQREYYKRRLLADPEFKKRHLAFVRRTDGRAKAKIRSIVAEFRSNGCALCGEMEPACLSAHHVDPTIKEFSVGEALRRRVSAKKLNDELSKCLCVCENCHRKIHAGVIVLVQSRHRGAAYGVDSFCFEVGQCTTVTGSNE
jgi:hypothetical protein